MNKGYVCAFCGETIPPDDGLAVQLVLTNLVYGGGEDDPAQTIFAHGKCVEERVIPGACFDAETLLPERVVN